MSKRSQGRKPSPRPRVWPARRWRSGLERRRRSLLAGIAALVVVAGAGAWWATADSGEPTARGSETRQSPPPAAGPGAPSATSSPQSPGPPPDPDNCRYKKVKPKKAKPTPKRTGASSPPADPYEPGGPGDPYGPGGPGDPYGPGGPGADAPDAPAPPPEPTPRFVGKPSKAIDTTKKYVATITTNRGDLVIELDVKSAPCTVNSFLFLARKGFFNDSKCPRMIAGRVVGTLECGDRIGPGYTFADENLTGARYTRGVVAMANNGKNANGSAFFIFFKDSQYPPQYTPFARVVGGSKVLDKIAKDAKPYDDYAPPGAIDSKVTIKKITISTR